MYLIASGGGTPRLTGGEEGRRSRGQAIYVILNLFQNLVFRCKDAKRRRRKASIEKLFPPIGEGAAQCCHCEGVKRPSQSQDSCNMNEITTSNASHSPRNDTKRTYRPNSYRLKNKLSSRFTLHPSLKQKAAFTLSEVLITLGIIGVVAALTIPAIYSNYKKNLVITRLKHTYSLLNQMVKMAETVNGEAANWEYVESSPIYNYSDDYWNKYFAPYIKTIKYCDINKSDNPDIGRECTIYVYNNDGEMQPIVTRFHKYILSNGVGIVPQADPNKYENFPVAFKVDLNISKSRPRAGVDWFQFNLNTFDNKTRVTSSMVWRSGASWSPNCDKINYDSSKRNLYIESCKAGRDYKETGYGLSFCTALIECNAWQIPADYPIKF